MSLIEKIFGSKKNSAQEAKNRLTLMFTRERTINVTYIDAMKQENLEVIKKYTKAQKIDVNSETNQNCNSREVEILLEK